MKIIRIIGVLVLLLFMVGSASACESGYYDDGYKGAYSISLDKKSDSVTYDHEGQVIKYTYTVKNTGRNTITENIQITDNKIPGIITIIEDLAPQATVTRTADYTIKREDMNAGYVTNTATAKTYFYISRWNKKAIQDEASATITRAMEITKSPDPTSYSKIGDVITYKYTIKNPSTKYKITQLTIIDDKTKVTLSSNTIPLGGSVTGTATYTITQDDLNAGFVTNVVYATGKYKIDRYTYIPVNSNEAKATVTALQASALELKKSASPETYNAKDQMITYRYIVKNTGNVQISGPIKVSDDKIGTFTISDSNLAPGVSVEGTATYTILPTDLSAGSVTNTAYATGKFNGNDVTSEKATATVTSTAKPPDTSIPEFPSIVLPVAAVLGIMFISHRRRKEK